MACSSKNQQQSQQLHRLVALGCGSANGIVACRLCALVLLCACCRSDISVWHKIRVVPTIYFYDEGAVVKKITMHDVRRMGENYSSVSGASSQMGPGQSLLAA